MAEYIKREELLSDFSDCNKNSTKWTVQRVSALIYRQPAADVAPVVHGRMVEADRPIRDGKSKVYGWECTVCKRFTRIPFVDSWNYCPNCGAKMDGDGDES